MRCFLSVVLMVCAAVSVTQRALAQGAVPKKSVKSPPHLVEFQRLDGNRDGKLSADEFTGGSVGKASEDKRRQHKKFDEDQDGTLSAEEFWKFQNKPAGEDWLRKDFAQRDKDKNGTLSLKEYLGNKSGALRIEAHSWFYRYDTDENEQVTLTEFLDRDPDRRVSVHNQFRVHDLDGDGQLTEQEFMRTRIGKSYEKAARENFGKFDTNFDRKLSEPEFTSLPGMVNQQTAIDQEKDARSRGRFGSVVAVVSVPLLLVAIVAWRILRSGKGRQKIVLTAKEA